jgi:hypothetical protein
MIFHIAHHCRLKSAFSLKPINLELKFTKRSMRIFLKIPEKVQSKAKMEFIFKFTVLRWAILSSENHEKVTFSPFCNTFSSIFHA